MEARFVSGKNVHINKESIKKVAYFDESGINFNIDLRIDNKVGKRMQALKKNDEILLDKIRNIILDSDEVERFNVEGSFLIIANKKVLHGRGAFNNLDDITIDSIDSAPRILIRSKGLNINKLQGRLL